ncbi:MAG: cytochrome c oxidase assembly protein subunit 15 [Planctomycetota bacterium]|jgi:cytochrome c oxidase assembly protein subunit 15
MSSYRKKSGSPLTYAFAIATWLSAIPLLLFGGLVTSLDAGMSIDGWMVLDPGHGDHFLLFYPIEKWFRDMGTISEHSHRLFGVLVGNLAIATWLLTCAKGTHRRGRLVAFSALMAVCVQGLIGGTRVLENSPQLAFLHGALAQIVFAVLAGSAVYLSPRYRDSVEVSGAESAQLRRGSLLALTVTYTAIFGGAWLRHSFSHAALGVHILLITLATVTIFRLAGMLKRYAGDDQSKKPLRSAARRLHMLVGMQLILGVASFWVVEMLPDAEGVDLHYSSYPTLHVLFGALILAQLTSTALWTKRVCTAASEPQVTH